MLTFPNCKINLGLNIVRRRDDGYHDLESVFYPLNICDALEIISTKETSTIQFSSTGLGINGTEQSNLCVKAYKLLKKDFPELPPAKIHLHKTVPVGSGLGGGSADAAFTLLLLNKKFQLGLSKQQLNDYALQLGSDCPFFIVNKACFVQGRGEVLEEIDLDLSVYNFLIVNPGIHIGTKWAFSKIQPRVPEHALKEIVQQPVETWKEKLVNDFEASMMQYYPGLKLIKQKLYDEGALYAGMSGSGSTFFGIFSSSKKVETNIFPGEYFVKLVNG
jgi:4-diphosphocytidyl-2-C-methyl-D-erythritol kinase